MLNNLLSGARSLWRAILRRPHVESEMHDKFSAHIQARTDDLIRHRFPPAEAARQARLEFGSAKRYKHESREARALPA